MDELPIFPNMAPLTERHLHILRDFVMQLDAPYSDANLLSLGSWNTNKKTSISRLYGGIMISMPHYRNSHRIYSFVQPHADNHALVAGLKILHDLGERPVLRFVPACSIDVEVPGELIIEEDRDNFDYISASAELAKMEGANYKRLRRFVAPHIEKGILSVKELELNPHNYMLLQGLFDAWMIGRHKENRDVTAERKAFMNAFSLLWQFNCRIYGLFHQEALVGWALYEIINKKYALAHFEKTDDSIEKMSYTFKVLVAKDLLGHCEYINYEQDLGIPGLRQAKSSLRPSHMLKKYTVKLRV